MTRIKSKDLYFQLRNRLSGHFNDENQASSEFRWLLQHAKQTIYTSFKYSRIRSTPNSSYFRKNTAKLNYFQKAFNTRNQLNWLDRAITQRTTHGKPLQYILGTQPFNNVEISVAKPTLIPRWETEEWSTALGSLIITALKKKDSELGRTHTRPFRILDLCTGTGCIALNLAQLLSEKNISVEVTGVDISEKAVKLANFNKTSNRKCFMNSAAQPNIRFLCLDIYSLVSVKNHPLLDNQFDIIVSNPPYISSKDYQTQLSKDVRDWEDVRALVPQNTSFSSSNISKNGLSVDSNETTVGTTTSKDGLEMLVYLIRLYEHMLSSSKISKSDHSPNLPKLVLEIGDDLQATKLRDIVKNSDTLRNHKLEVWNDLSGNPRTLVVY